VSGRHYRLSPPDDLGVLFGLTAPQVSVLAATLVLAVLAVVRAGPGAGVALLTAGAAVALGRLNGQPLLDSVPPAMRWAGLRLGRRDQWFAPLPLAAAPGAQPALPPSLAGQRVLAVPVPDVAGGREVAVVEDQRAGRYAATVRVAGSRFVLLEPAEQDRLLQWWGTALAAFCSDRTPVAGIRWSQWSSPAGIEEQHAYLREHRAADPVDSAAASYEELIEAAGPLATRHEVLVTLTVAADLVATGRAHRGDRRQAAVDALLAELGQFSRRMKAAGLVVSSPLTPGELARAVRARLDPACVPPLDRRGRSLGDRAGLVAVPAAGPLATRAAWTHWQADGHLHRALLVARWPLLDVPAAWMQELLLQTSSVRTVCVLYEPVSRATSRRRVLRDAARIESDADQRAARGFRVGAQHRQAARAVADREEELVSGFAELDYVGVVVVSAPDLDGLERATADAVQAGAGAGLELRPLDGRHDAAVAATLPLARSLAPRGAR